MESVDHVSPKEEENPEEERPEAAAEDPVTDDEYASEVESRLTPGEVDDRRREAIDLKNKGNELFKSQSYQESLELYTSAIRLCPVSCLSDRSVMYANRAAARIHLNEKDKAIGDCTRAIDMNPEYVKALLRRAQLWREKTEKLDEALADYKKVLELDPACAEARAACAQLPGEINERNEKMKTEMLGKLKDLGNVVLKPFGLSTDNFKLQQTDGGGYTINFQS